MLTASSADGQDPPPQKKKNGYPGYDTRLYLMVRHLLPGPLWFRVVVPEVKQPLPGFEFWLPIP